MAALWYYFRGGLLHEGNSAMRTNANSRGPGQAPYSCRSDSPSPHGGTRAGDTGGAAAAPHHERKTKNPERLGQEPIADARRRNG